MKAFILAAAAATLLIPRPAAAQGDSVDSFATMAQMNQAQLVMLVESGLMEKPLARDIARALRTVMNEAARPGAKISGDYLALEKRLVDMAGPRASTIHMGRSRIDLGATTERMILRDELLAVFTNMLAAREGLLKLAAANVRTIIPGYTHAVQAQPTTLGHYLSALASVLERDAERLRGAYGRVNQSPLGSAAFGTSGFPLNRDRLAQLLGFPALIENSYDATGHGTADAKAEVAAALAISALSLGRFAQDLVIQYGDPSPGMILTEKMTGHSSIMPQKRNPGVIERLRYSASAVAGDAQTVWMVAHNTPVGDVGDVRANLLRRATMCTDGAKIMYVALRDIAAGLVVRPERTLAEVDADYSTMTELADTLLREAGVPFREGHHFASELTTYGRARGKRPKDLSFGEAAEIYQKANGAKIPITEKQFRDSLDPVRMIENRKGRGGPQSAEVERMLAGHRQQLERESAWLDSEKQRLKDSYAALDRAFEAVAQ